MKMFSRTAPCLAVLAAGFVMFAGAGWAQTASCPTPQAKRAYDSCYRDGLHVCANKYNVQTTSFLKCTTDLKTSCTASSGCQ
jgi:hypothetical protein